LTALRAYPPICRCCSLFTVASLHCLNKNHSK
jgi:hypothetical protein